MTDRMLATYILGWYLSDYTSDGEWKTINRIWNSRVLNNFNSARENAAEEVLLCMEQALEE